MKKTTTKALLSGLAIAATAALLAGCGSAPTTETTSGSASDVVDGFKPCLVSDAGGWDDKSFNESAKNGMDKAAKELGVTPLEVDSGQPDT